MKGRIHSFQSLACSDGPGVRFGVFLQGCPNRCVYCHNPDTLPFDGGEEYSSDEVAEKVLRYRPYFGRDGGVTVSGGEPLCQWEFVFELFEKLKRYGIGTALDTSGVGASPEEQKKLLTVTDTVLCDLKFPTEEKCRKYCGFSLKKTLDFLAVAEESGVPVLIRHVVVPGLTDSEESVLEIKKLAQSFSNITGVELLPFCKLCTQKYRELGLPFLLESTPECPPETLLKLQKLVFREPETAISK